MDKEKKIDNQLFDSLNGYESSLPSGGWDALAGRKEKKRRKSVFMGIAAALILIAGISILMRQPGNISPTEPQMSLLEEKNNTLAPVPGNTNSTAKETATEKPVTANNKETISGKGSARDFEKSGSEDYPSDNQQTQPVFEPTPPSASPTGNKEQLTVILLHNMGKMPLAINTSLPALKDVQQVKKYRRPWLVDLYASAGLGGGQLKVTPADIKKTTLHPAVLSDSEKNSPFIRTQNFEVGLQLSKGGIFSAGFGGGFSNIKIARGPYAYYSEMDSVGSSSITSKVGVKTDQNQLPTYNAVSLSAWCKAEMGRRFRFFVETGIRSEYLLRKKGSINTPSATFMQDPVPGTFTSWNFIAHAGAGISYPVFRNSRLYASYSYGTSLQPYYLKDDLNIGFQSHEIKLRFDLPINKIP